ncbi:MAG: diacylglycerol kinase family protein [Coriobacteriia bacterium]|jgi:diacylglycerol kinase|nr:diacylglycerol kinase family protein [Coriobacteriia bacterium]MDR2714232.1 diacylglycerol kinase family protein [Coriobacteriales bacterium]
MKHLVYAFSCALSGIAHTARTQRSFQIQLAVAVAAVIGGFVVCLTPVEWAVVLILVGLVLTLECLNTALEATIDRCSTDLHPLAKTAKDAAAGAVLIMALIAAVVGLIIYCSAIMRLAG